MPGWLPITLGFVVIQGTLGVVVKLALRQVPWPELLLWTAAAYTLLAIALTADGGSLLVFEPGFQWAVASAICATGGLILFFLALERGEASRVIPVTAAYPMVSAALAVPLLAESVTPVRMLGILLAVGGVVLLSRR